MKKFLLLSFVALLATSMSAQKLDMSNKITLDENIKFERVVAPRSKAVSNTSMRNMHRISPAFMKDKYKVFGLEVNDDYTGFLPEVATWDCFYGTEEYKGKTYEMLYDVIIPGVFNTPLGLDYVYDEKTNLIVVWAVAVYKFNDGTYLCVLDVDDFDDGGTGDIVLVPGKDGSLQIHPEQAEDVFGYFVAKSIDDYSGAPVELTNDWYAACAGMEYLNEEQLAAIGRINTSSKSHAMVNLMGQRVNENAKGIIIKNGKKILKK